MSETDDALDSAPVGQAAVAPRSAADVGPVQRGGGRLVGTIALLLALLASGVAGYLYYRLEWQGGLASLRDAASTGQEATQNEIRELDTRLQGLENSLAAEDTGAVTLDLLEERLEAQRAGFDESLADLRGALGTALQAAPPTTREWQLAEVEYLSRIANHRVLLEKDPRGALQLLEAADAILEDLDDFAFFDVRRALAEEMAQLKAVQHVDIEGSYVQLEALKKRIDTLPLRLPEYVAQHRPSPPEPADAASAWRRFIDRLSGLVRFRQHPGDGLLPLLGPAEAGYLEMNLRLALERAQLALLRDDASLYTLSLDGARSWLHQHLDATSPAVAEFAHELDVLGELTLGQPLPDLSRSFRLLREARGEPQQAPRPPDPGPGETP